MQPDVVADLPRQQRMLVRGIVSDQQDRRGVVHLAHGRGRVRLALQSGCESREVGGAVMVDVVGLQHDPRKLRKQVILFVGRAVGADHADRLPSLLVAGFRQALADHAESLFPGGRSEFSMSPDQRLFQALGVVREVEGVAPLDAQEVIVDAALVAVVAAHNLHAGIGAAHAQRGLAAIAAMGADGADMLHLPGTGLVAIRARGERADRANVDAHAALFALQVIFFIGRNDGTDTAVLHAQRPHVHAFAADAHAAVAQDAARPVEEHHRRPLLLILVLLGLHVPGFGGAVGERHVLQFAFAARVAHRAVQGMVAEQQLDHRLTGLAYFFIVAGDDHALADHRGARGLQLGHLFDLHQAHAAGALQRQVGVVAERGHFNARRSCRPQSAASPRGL